MRNPEPSERAWCGLQSGEGVAGDPADRQRCPAEGKAGPEGSEGKQ